MDIFVSWSGERSKSLAEALRVWLPKVIQNLKPWISVSDIEKGAPWLKDISEKLETTNFGIFCLTPENIHEPWILFEAGALSKALGSSLVCPILHGFDPSSLSGPLSQFQATKLQKEDMHNLLKSINKCLGDQALPTPQLEESFEMWWPNLEKSINEIPPANGGQKTERTERELLVEILNTVRNFSRQKNLSDQTSRVLSTLTPKEEKILRMRFGIGVNEELADDIAKDFGLTAERIRAIEAKALRKLREPSRDQNREGSEEDT
mgnify:FL=1